MKGKKIVKHGNKDRWQQHKKWILVVLGIGILSYGGIQYQQYLKTKQALKASVFYDNLIMAVQKPDNATVIKEAKILIEEYPKTPYAPLAALMLAKVSVEENDLQGAIDHLRFAIKKGKKLPSQPIAKVRLARILAKNENYDEALSTLNEGTVPEGYVTLFEETKGDIYLLLNEKDKAREAYQVAIKSAPPGVPTTRLQFKQMELGIKEAS